MAMGTFYAHLQAVATAPLGAFKQGAVRQGAVQLKRVKLGTPLKQWTPAPATWPLSATAKRLHQRYENGVLIVETGDMVRCAVPEVEPQITDRLIIDGAERVNLP